MCFPHRGRVTAVADHFTNPDISLQKKVSDSRKASGKLRVVVYIVSHGVHP